jgi:hypothetical protein
LAILDLKVEISSISCTKQNKNFGACCLSLPPVKKICLTVDPQHLPATACSSVRRSTFCGKRTDSAWLDSRVTLGVGLPLPQGQILELYTTNESLKPDIEQELSNDLPDPRHPTLSEFETLVTTREKLAGTDRSL